MSHLKLTCRDGELDPDTTLAQHQYMSIVDSNSKYCIHEMPIKQIPENALPPDVAYRIIDGNLAHDGTPARK